MNHLKELIGKDVKQVTNEVSNTYPVGKRVDILSNDIQTEIFVRLVFDSYTLDIYNPIKLAGIISYIELINRKVLKVQESDDKIVLSFENNAVLFVDMWDESYNGPEAVVLNGPNNLCVVWN
jgi:hypothetical protein